MFLPQNPKTPKPQNPIQLSEGLRVKKKFAFLVCSETKKSTNPGKLWPDFPHKNGEGPPDVCFQVQFGDQKRKTDKEEFHVEHDVALVRGAEEEAPIA